MNKFGLLPPEEDLVQRSAGEVDQWRGYMTDIAINVGSIDPLPFLLQLFAQC